MIWAAIFLSGLATFLMRFLPLSLLAGWQMPPVWRRALHFVPASILAAIIAPAVLMPEGSLMLTDNLRLPAAILAAAIALRTGSVVATLLSGLGFIWLLGLL
jgi:branched-subunit amino acid transport protein